MTQRGVSIAAVVTAVCLVSGAIWSLLADGADVAPGVLRFTVVAAVALALGEGIRTTIDDRSSAPISLAAGMALAMSPVLRVGEFMVSTGDVVLVTAAAMTVAGAARAVVGRPLALGDMVARLLAVTLTSVLAHDIGNPNEVAWMANHAHPRWLVALALVCTVVPGVLMEAALRSWAWSRAADVPLGLVLREGFVGGGGLAMAVVTAAPIIVLTRQALGAWGIPFSLGPLVLAQFAVRRHAAVRSTYRQTIAALSRLTDLTGYTANGHASRVADLSVRVGRELTMSSGELTRLEYAALLHDLGQVALRVPIPRGATVLAAPSDQQRIANDGARIVRGTGVLDDVAHTLERQTTPFRQVREFDEDLPRNARVIKVVNAFDDLTKGSRARADVAAAMERIHLGLGYEYDPEVVDALQRVLARRTSTL